jgi:hypothetical protein
MFKIGDRVRSSCEKHDICRKLRGTVIAIRTNSFYKYQVRWDGYNNDDSWMTENGLELERK